MKNAIIREKMDFNEYCKNTMKEAIIIAAAFVASLNLTNLKTQNRLGRIYIENDGLINEIELLDRVNYILHALDIPALFLLFDKMNYLRDSEELAKLKQAFILVEKHHSLNKLIIETLATQEEENFNSKLWALKAMKNMNGLDKMSYEEIKLPKKDDCPQEEKQSSLISNTKSEKKLENEKVSFGCKIPLRLLKDEIQRIYNKTHFLASQADVDNFNMALFSDDLSEVTNTFYLKCQTNKFKSIIILLQKDFNSLSYANIERSNLFRSKKGKPISRSNMSSGNCIILEKKHFLKDIYK